MSTREKFYVKGRGKRRARRTLSLNDIAKVITSVNRLD